MCNANKGLIYILENDLFTYVLKIVKLIVATDEVLMNVTQIILC